MEHYKNPLDLDTYDWREFSLSGGDNWRNYYDTGIGYAHNFINFLNRSVALPHEPIYSKIIASYAICNSKACNILPIMIIYGASGTGKSRVSDLIAYYRNQIKNIFASGGTFASIRNKLEELRWQEGVGDNKAYWGRSAEKPTLFVWADIKECNLDTIDGKMYALFRNGCDRKEEVISIAGVSGSNLTFHTFAPKILSTVDDFFRNPKWAELYRRTIFIKTTDFSALPEECMEEYNSRDLMDMNAIDWEGIEYEFFNHWDAERLSRYQSLHRNRKSFLQKLNDYPAITPHRYTISYDLIITGLSSDLFDSIDDCLSVWNSYWDIVDREIAKEATPLQSFLDKWLYQQSQPYLEVGLSPRLDAKQLHKSITKAVQEQVLYSQPREKELFETLNDLGWRRTNDPNGKPIIVRI